VKNRRRWFILAAVLVSLALSFAILEVGLRLFLHHRLKVMDERNVLYRYDETLGWFPQASVDVAFGTNRRIRVRQNSAGFRDAEHGTKEKARIVVLGDSFVWGYDVNAEERFTEQLAKRLPNWEILNLGVSGYGTDQAYLLLRRFFEAYDPDIVFLVFCEMNDDDDNSVNRAQGYFKPYFVETEDGLDLRGTPVPHGSRYFISRHPWLSRSYVVRALVKSYDHIALRHVLLASPPTNAILLEMRRFVQSRDARFFVGLQNDHPDLEAFMTEKQIPWVMLKNDFVYDSHGLHWTPKGHAYARDRILAFLKQQGVVKP
jgi:hypothetical protein